MNILVPVVDTVVVAIVDRLEGGVPLTDRNLLI
jgi:hypothetical protein